MSPFTGVPNLAQDDPTGGTAAPALATTYNPDDHTLPVIQAVRLSDTALTLPVVKNMLSAAIASEDPVKAVTDSTPVCVDAPSAVIGTTATGGAVVPAERAGTPETPTGTAV